jgi:hypothetical protein
MSYANCSSTHTPKQEIRMRRATLAVAASLAIVVTACGKQDGKPLDDALKTDLALASQTQPYNPQQVMSPTEQGLAGQAAPNNLQAVARQPVAAQPVRRTSSTRRSSGGGASRSGGSSGGGSGAYYPPQVQVEKHTERDAAIGAAAGAVIGATSSRHKVQGGLIGAAIGGILGGVVGNNVDVKRTPF